MTQWPRATWRFTPKDVEEGRDEVRFGGVLRGGSLNSGVTLLPCKSSGSFSGVCRRSPLLELGAL